MPGRTAETAKMVAELDLKTQKFTKGVQTAIGSVGKLSASVAKSRAVAVALGVGLERAAETGLRAVGNAIGDGLNSLADLETAATANAAAIKQVGLAGKVTAGQIEEWSVQIETAVGSAFDDKAINAAAGTLIRFGKVTAGNLRPALVVMTDLATKTGDVDSAATLLARALADPTKAAGKLARQGIVLTKAQQDQIKAFVKAGKTAQAQKVILDALSATTAGAAKASQGPYKESINQLRDAYEEATKALAVGFLPIITKVRDILTKALARPETLARIRDFGKTIAAGLSSVVDFASKVNWSNIADRVSHAFGIIAGAVSVIRAGWDKIPDPLKNLLLGGIIADRTLKFLVNVSPIKIAVDFAANALAGLVGGVGKAVGASIVGAGLGKFFIQPVFVTNPGFGVPGGPGVLPGVAEGAAGAAGAAAGISVAAVAALVLAPVAIAAAGLLLTKLTDPTGERNTTGKSDTATSRHIPDWNNKALQELEGIKNGVNGGFAALPGKLADDLVPLAAKTEAVAKNIQTTAAQHDAEVTAAIKAAVAALPTGKQVDDTTFAATIAANVVAMTPKFVPTVKLDPSQITDLRNVTGGNTAATQRDEETSKSIQSLIAQTDLVAKSSDISSLAGITDSGLGAVDTSTIRGAAATSSAATQAGFHAASQTFSSGIGIEGAIARNRPIINVDVSISATTINRVKVVEDRGGSRDSSRDGDGGGGPGQ